MDIMGKINEFLNNEELVNFFMVKGYRPTIENGWFVLIDNNKNKSEKMKVFNDLNNSKRIRFKGKNWAFSINKNNENKLYLDHLLIGNVEKDEYDFIMRHNIDENNNNQFIIKLIDDKNKKHIYEINEDEINIERITIKVKNYSESHSIKDYINQNVEYEHENFSFYKDENNKVKIKDDSIEYAKDCIKEFLILEKSYITITNYIEKRIPFITECINECNVIRELNVKPYEIKRQNDEENKTYQKKIG